MYQGWKVAIAGFLINLFTGIIYTWSIVASHLHLVYGWSYTEATLPYSLFILVYPPSMILAGRLQDKFGPRIVVLTGGLVLSATVTLASFLITPFWTALLCGVVYGMALAFIFASLTPAAIKWFGPGQKGLVTGIVVLGTGLSAFFAAPVAHLLITSFGLPRSFQIASLVILLGVLLPLRYISNPPQAAHAGKPTAKSPSAPARAQEEGEQGLRDVLTSPQFYILWIMFSLVAGTGLSFVSHLDTISRVHFGFAQGFLMVSFFSLFNASGRLIAGYVSDRIGRRQTMTIFFSALTATMLLTLFFRAPLFLFIAAPLVGMTYGSIFTLFPATVSSLFGEKNFGLFYGLIFSGMMVGGFFPLLTSYFYQLRGDFTAAIIILATICAITVSLSLVLRRVSVYRSVD